MPIIGLGRKAVATKIAEAVAEAEKRVTMELNNAKREEISTLTAEADKQLAKLKNERDSAKFSYQQIQEQATLAEQVSTLNEKLVQKLQDKLASALKPKTVEKILPNGNKLVYASNKNGAKMLMELTPAGKPVRVEIETLDGRVKKMIYDPITGKPILSFSNASGKPIKTNYKDGHLIETKEVNVRKPKTKPTPMNNAINVSNSPEYKTRTVTIPYTDGSQIIERYDLTTTAKLSTEYFKPNETEWYKKHIFNWDYKGTTLTKTRVGSNDFDPHYFYKNGIVVDHKTTTGSSGMHELHIKTTYGKENNTAIKSKREIFGGKDLSYLLREERKLKNGDLVTISFDPDRQCNQGSSDWLKKYKVKSLEIQSKTGNKTLEDREALIYLRENEPPHLPIQGYLDEQSKHSYI